MMDESRSERTNQSVHKHRSTQGDIFFLSLCRLRLSDSFAVHESFPASLDVNGINPAGLDPIEMPFSDIHGDSGHYVGEGRTRVFISRQ